VGGSVTRLLVVEAHFVKTNHRTSSFSRIFGASPLWLCLPLSCFFLHSLPLNPVVPSLLPPLSLSFTLSLSLSRDLSLPPSLPITCTRTHRNTSPTWEISRKCSVTETAIQNVKKKNTNKTRYSKSRASRTSTSTSFWYFIMGFLTQRHNVRKIYPSRLYGNVCMWVVCVCAYACMYVWILSPFSNSETFLNTFCFGFWFC